MLAQCDVVTINCPLHEKTRGMFNKELISKMKKGSWLVNTARGAIVVKEDVAAALKSGHLRGYGGDVWDMQPAPKDHVLRTAKSKLYLRPTFPAFKNPLWKILKSEYNLTNLYHRRLWRWKRNCPTHVWNVPRCSEALRRW